MYSFYVRPYYLLDTNIVSEPTKPKQNQNVMENITRYSSVSAVSSITLAEMRKGIRMLNTGSKQQMFLENYFTEEIPSLYQEIVFDRSAAIIYGDIDAELRKQGKPKSELDLMLAATAIANGMILVTRNTKHFEDIPSLNIENWFEPDTN